MEEQERYCRENPSTCQAAVTMFLGVTGGPAIYGSLQVVAPLLATGAPSKLGVVLILGTATQVKSSDDVAGHLAVAAAAIGAKAEPAAAVTPKRAAAAYHPGAVNAYVDKANSSSIMRQLRASGTAEGHATAKLIKRGIVKLETIAHGPRKSPLIAGEHEFGTDKIKIYLDRVRDAREAAGAAAHETRHYLDKITPMTYSQAHEFRAFQWQARVDPRTFKTDEALIDWIAKHKLYKDIPKGY